MKYLFLLFLFVLYSKTVMACPMFQPLTEDEMNQAQSVFFGEAIDYEISTPPEPAKITFYVKKMISGREIEGDITVNWIHGTFGEPEDLASFKQEYGELTKVGILFPEKFPEKCEMYQAENGLGESLGEREFCSSSFIGSGKSEYPWVLNRHCSGPYMFAE